MCTSQHIVAVSVRVVHICSSKSWLTRTNATGRNALQTANTLIPRKQSCSRYATIDDFSCTETQADGSFAERIPKDFFSFRDVAKQRQQNNNNKNFGHNEPGSRETLFFLFILFISFILLIEFNFVLILLIEFNFVLTFLKDARERGRRTRRLPESTARSGRARSHGLTV